jgi:opacity protein-like surface antigen
MSFSPRTGKSFILAVVVALWTVFFLQPAAADPSPPPTASAEDRNTTVRAQHQRSLDTWHGIRDYKAGDDQRRVNLRLAVRARPYNGYTYVKGYIAVTCETQTGSGWRRYPCSTQFEIGLGVEGGVFGGYAEVYFGNSGADGFYSAYTTPWVRTRCPTTVYATAGSAHAGVNWIEIGLYYRYFVFGLGGDEEYPVIRSNPYTLTCP